MNVCHSYLSLSAGNLNILKRPLDEPAPATLCLLWLNLKHFQPLFWGLISLLLFLLLLNPLQPLPAFFEISIPFVLYQSALLPTLVFLSYIRLILPFTGLAQPDFLVSYLCMAHISPILVLRYQILLSEILPQFDTNKQITPRCHIQLALF